MTCLLGDSAQVVFPFNSLTCVRMCTLCVWGRGIELRSFCKNSEGPSQISTSLLSAQVSSSARKLQFLVPSQPLTQEPHFGGSYLICSIRS